MNAPRLPRSGASCNAPNNGNYVSTIPTGIPVCQCVIYNNADLGITPRRKPDVQGFRAWLAPLDPLSVEVCACGWAPELPVHFRVRRMRVDEALS